MYALLKLALSKDDIQRLLDHFEAREIQLVNGEHGEALTAEVVKNGGFSVNYGGYGRKITLGTGKSFASKWEAATHEELFDAKKPFANVTVFLHESVPQLERDAIDAFVTKNGGLTNAEGGAADLWIHALKPREASTAIPEQVIRADLNAVLDAFPRAAKALEKSIEAAPAAKGGRARKAKITPEQIAAFEEITVLLGDKDLAKVNEGLLRSSELSEHIDHLLGGLKAKDGRLSDSGAYRKLGREKYRDFIVYNLLSMAPAESKAGRVRACITNIHLRSAKILPVLKGFDALEALTLTLSRSEQGEAIASLIDREFSLEMGFSGCSEFPALLYLHTTAPLQGLAAPMLDELILASYDAAPLEAGAIPPSVTRLSLRNIQSLCDLGFLVGNKAIQRIHIADCPALRDISALASLPSLTHAVIKADIETPPTTWPKSLVHLEAETWACESIGQLPQGLTHFSLRACTGITNLSCIEHCKAPFADHALGINVTNREKIVNVRSSKEGEHLWLDFESGDYSTAGVSPAGQLRLGGCRSLVSLEGLVSGCGLKQISLPSHPIDVSVLAGMPDVTVVIEKRSDDIIQSLSGLPKLRLKIVKCDSLKDLEFLEPLFSNLVVLDLTQVYTVKDVSAVIKMDNLAELKIDGRSDNPAMAQLKKSRFTSKGQIDAFRLKFMAGG